MVVGPDQKNILRLWPLVSGKMGETMTPGVDGGRTGQGDTHARDMHARGTPLKSRPRVYRTKNRQSVSKQMGKLGTA